MPFLCTVHGYLWNCHYLTKAVAAYSELHTVKYTDVPEFSTVIRVRNIFKQSLGTSLSDTLFKEMNSVAINYTASDQGKSL